jgi:hypothetical protein
VRNRRPNILTEFVPLDEAVAAAFSVLKNGLKEQEIRQWPLTSLKRDLILALGAITPIFETADDHVRPCTFTELERRCRATVDVAHLMIRRADLLDALEILDSGNTSHASNSGEGKPS